MDAENISMDRVCEARFGEPASVDGRRDDVDERVRRGESLDLEETDESPVRRGESLDLEEMDESPVNMGDG